MKPNILFLMTDQMRGDCLGIANHPDVKTPYLDTLAMDGHYFPNAYSACPSCIAARAELMTGLSPRNNKRVGYRDGINWEYKTTLAGELNKAGYYCKCVGKMHVHPIRNNLGFNDVVLHDGYLGFYRKHDIPFHEHQTIADDYFHWLKCELGADADIIDTGIECNSWIARPFIYEERYHPTNWVVANCIDFLRKRDRSMPFFLYASFVRPHPPFDAPQCYFDMYRDLKLTPPVIGEWADHETYKTARRYDGDVAFSDMELMRQAQIGYYACITHLDHQIGRLLQALQADGCAENTVILFSADHGELLGDHHTYRKVRPYQGSVRIPLILTAPSSILNGSGVKHNQVVALRDIMPTLIELAGGEIPDGLDGESLIKVIDSGRVIRGYLHGEHSGGSLGNHYIVTNKDKFIWFTESGREQYFDLATDPNECHDLIADVSRKERIDELRNILNFEMNGKQLNTCLDTI